MEDLTYQRKYWRVFAKESKKDILSQDLHPSWSKDSQSYEEVTSIPDDYLKEISRPYWRALDFGVGMGRNYGYLNSIFSEVYGFDTEEMIDRHKEHDPDAKNLFHDVDEVLSRKYDLVYESVAMQHMPPQEVLLYLNLISKKAKYFFSWTRVYNDFKRDFQRCKGGVNLFSLIKSLNAFELIKCSLDPEVIENKMDETHYMALYKCRNFS